MRKNKLLAFTVGLYLLATAVCRADVTNIRDFAVTQPPTDGLTASQAQQIPAIVREAHARDAATMQSTPPLYAAIRASLGGAGPVDGAGLLQMRAQIDSTVGQMQLADLNYLLQIRALLTPEQLSELAAHFRPVMLKYNDEDPTIPQNLTRFYGDDLGLTRGQHLSAGQAAQQAALRAAMLPKLVAIQRESDDDSAQLDALLNSAGSVTYEQLASLQQRISELRGEREAAVLDLVIKTRALLTPEQLTKAVTLHEQLSVLHAEETRLRNN
jgi:hypothetical protein